MRSSVASPASELLRAAPALGELCAERALEWLDEPVEFRRSIERLSDEQLGDALRRLGEAALEAADPRWLASVARFGWALCLAAVDRINRAPPEERVSLLYEGLFSFGGKAFDSHLLADWPVEAHQAAAQAWIDAGASPGAFWPHGLAGWVRFAAIGGRDAAHGRKRAPVERTRATALGFSRAGVALCLQDLEPRAVAGFWALADARDERGEEPTGFQTALWADLELAEAFFAERGGAPALLADPGTLAWLACNEEQADEATLERWLARGVERIGDAGDGAEIDEMLGLERHDLALWSLRGRPPAPGSAAGDKIAGALLFHWQFPLSPKQRRCRGELLERFAQMGLRARGDSESGADALWAQLSRWGADEDHAAAWRAFARLGSAEDLRLFRSRLDRQGRSFPERFAGRGGDAASLLACWLDLGLWGPGEADFWPLLFQSIELLPSARRADVKNGADKTFLRLCEALAPRLAAPDDWRRLFGSRMGEGAEEGQACVALLAALPPEALVAGAAALAGGEAAALGALREAGLPPCEALARAQSAKEEELLSAWAGRLGQRGDASFLARWASALTLPDAPASAEAHAACAAAVLAAEDSGAAPLAEALLRWPVAAQEAHPRLIALAGAALLSRAAGAAPSGPSVPARRL
jgi:hypothetical protein